MNRLGPQWFTPRSYRLASRLNYWPSRYTPRLAWPSRSTCTIASRSASRSTCTIASRSASRSTCRIASSSASRSTCTIASSSASIRLASTRFASSAEVCAGSAVSVTSWAGSGLTRRDFADSASIRRGFADSASMRASALVTRRGFTNLAPLRASSPARQGLDNSASMRAYALVTRRDFADSVPLQASSPARQGLDDSASMRAYALVTRRDFESSAPLRASSPARQGLDDSASPVIRASAFVSRRSSPAQQDSSALVSRRSSPAQQVSSALVSRRSSPTQQASPALLSRRYYSSPASARQASPARQASSHASSSAPPSSSHSKWRKYARAAVVILAFGGAVYTIDRFAYSSLLTRSIRALYGFSEIALVYTALGKYRFNSLDEIHQYAADRLLSVLMTNKGIYIKLGQAIANQGSLLPLAFQKTFVKLYDDAATDDWSSVDQVLRLNLGPDYESRLFEWIDHDPVASASIAQVHRAKLKSTDTTQGTEVAIKVQHDYISQQIEVDLFVYRLISKLYERVFGIPFSFFTRYISDQLITETNFLHELENAEGLRLLLDNDSQLSSKDVNAYLPTNYSDLSTEQVLISEWITGTSLTDKQKLIDQNCDLTQIMNQYLTVFGKQIFDYGFVHSDPHPGNLLVRRDSKGHQQLVILDHGLYIRLPEQFRLEYGQLWRYLFEFNQEGISDIASSWGINSTDLFATLVQLQPVSSAPQLDKSKPDTRNVNDLLVNFLSDEGKFPLQLIFLARTMRMMQNLNQTMGSPVNRVNVLTVEAIDALYKHTRVNRDFGFVQRTWQTLSLLKLRVVLLCSNVVFYAIRLKQIWVGDRFGGHGEGIEDYIEKYMQNTAKSLGFDIPEEEAQ